MNHPLDAITLKLFRAKEHFGAIADEITRHKDNCRIAEEEIPGTDRVNLIAEFSDPTVLLGIIVGDCLHNLRSALDHLVWQLALIGPLGNPTPRNQFPICRDATAWDAQIKGHRLDGIPDAAKAEIEAMQPYLSGLESLSWLNDLVNIDKHRTLAFTYVTTQNWLGDIVYPVNDSNRIICSVARADVEKVKLQLQGGLSVAFTELHTPNRFDATIVLRAILEYTGNHVIPTFRQFFN